MKFNLAKFLKKQRAYIFVAFIVAVFIFIFMTFRVREGAGGDIDGEDFAKYNKREFDNIKATLTRGNVDIARDFEKRMTNNDISDEALLPSNEAMNVVNNPDSFTFETWKAWIDADSSCPQCSKLSEIMTTLKGRLANTVTPSPEKAAALEAAFARNLSPEEQLAAPVEQ
jgi:hypothetical protein